MTLIFTMFDMVQLYTAQLLVNFITGLKLSLLKFRLYLIRYRRKLMEWFKYRRNIETAQFRRFPAALCPPAKQFGGKACNKVKALFIYWGMILVVQIISSRIISRDGHPIKNCPFNSVTDPGKRQVDHASPFHKSNHKKMALEYCSLCFLPTPFPKFLDPLLDF